jgi:glucose-6-phosphate isomerase
MSEAMLEAMAAAWRGLEALPRPKLTDLFASDSRRLAKLTARLELGDDDSDGILFDWSKTHLDDAHLSGFLALAAAAGFAERRAALFAGDVVNTSEHRAAEHTAQRGLGRETSVEEAAALHARMRSLVAAIHGGALGEIRHLIHIGIGGSA